LTIDKLTLATGHDNVACEPTCAQSLAEALRLVAYGDRNAFEEVYKRTSANLFSVCLQILPMRPEAEDTLQDVYCSVWRSAATFDAKRGTAMTWLITLARNR
jgi:DNA-directed RNA polymerase specialized sigma24 family protein